MNGLPVTLIEAQVSGVPIYASSNITEETNISDNIKFISLKENPTVWAEKILSCNNRRKIMEKNIIRQKGYDDKSETTKLQNKYIELIEEGAVDGKSITY